METIQKAVSIICDRLNEILEEEDIQKRIALFKEYELLKNFLSGAGYANCYDHATNHWYSGEPY